MRVLMQFMLLCQMLIDLMTGYSWQGDCCCREDVSKGQSRRELEEVEKRKEEASWVQAQVDLARDQCITEQNK